MTRSDRLAEPVSLMFDNGQVLGLSAAPCITNAQTGSFINFNGFSCNISDNGLVSVGFTLGYENAPWLFVQTATVKNRESVQAQNCFTLSAGADFSFLLSVYNYKGDDERAVYKAIEDVYWQFHESPRKIDGMNPKKAVQLLSSAIRDYAWLDDEKIYSGFVYDRPEGFALMPWASSSLIEGLVSESN